MKILQQYESLKGHNERDARSLGFPYCFYSV